ncbi:hypothetical protein BDN67DRAFT_976648 [Paxillus ammoniavirescens]|nr:hypothetical protein BDN67DRAFT_976648 [Paxillus ammoniavirescens]
MFARLTPTILALLAIVGIAAARDCQTVCCKSAGNSPSGWQGSSCTPVGADGACAYTKLCCYDIEGDSAAECTSPQQ